MFFELATLSMPIGVVSRSGKGTQAAMDAIAGYLDEPGRRGRLLACWVSELSPQNQILVLRGFTGREDLEAERHQVLMSRDPFGLGSTLVGLKVESFAQFPGFPPVQPGDFGPYYEMRTYRLKIGGLEPTIAAWQAGVPARVALSPLVNVMYALDGAPRFVHVWAYRTLDERMEIRAEAVRLGVWPAKGAPQWLTPDLTSELYMPTALSPLQ